MMLAVLPSRCEHRPDPSAGPGGDGSPCRTLRYPSWPGSAGADLLFRDSGGAGGHEDGPADPVRDPMIDAMSSSNRRSPPSGKPPPGTPPKRPSALEAGFERWLNTQLHKMYDPVLEERIPDELSRLLEAFDERPPGGKEPPGK